MYTVQIGETVILIQVSVHVTMVLEDQLVKH